MTGITFTAEEQDNYRKAATPYPDRMIKKFRIVLNALDADLRVQVNDLMLTFAGEDFANGAIHRDDIGFVSEVTINGGEPQETFFLLEMTVGDFKRFCDRISTEEAVLIASGTTLRKMALENIAKREKSMAERKKRK